MAQKSMHDGRGLVGLVDAEHAGLNLLVAQRGHACTKLLVLCGALIQVPPPSPTKLHSLFPKRTDLVQREGALKDEVAVALIKSAVSASFASS
jgi:hypothetical protein